MSINMSINIMDITCNTILVTKKLSEFSSSSFQTNKFSVQLIEIVKRPGQTLGLYIREGNGADRQEGVFISRIALESPVYNSGCLRVGDEVLAVNLVDVTRMSLDDVVIIMSIPRRLLLTTRSRRGARQPQHQPNRNEPKPPPVVVLKKDYEEEPLDDSTSNGDQLRLGALGRPPQPHGMAPQQERFSTLPRYRPPDMSLRHEESLMYYNKGGPQGPPPLPPHYGIKPGPSPVPSIGGMGPPHATHPGYAGRGGRLPGLGGRGGYGIPPGADHLYQPPPPVITEQPRQRPHPNFYQYDRSYPKTLESLAERIHSFYGPPRPPGQQSMEQDIGYGGTLGRSTAGRPHLSRTLSEQRLPASEREALSDYEGSSSVSAARRYKAWQQASLAPLHQAYGSGEGATLDRYQEAMRRLSALRQRTRSVDYASDTEVLAPRPFAARPRSASSRSNSLPRQRHHRASIGGIDPLALRNAANVGRGVRSSLGPGMRLGGTGRHSLAGSEDESDGAVSAPEMSMGPRHERGKRRSSATTTATTSTTSASPSRECRYGNYNNYITTNPSYGNTDIVTAEGIIHSEEGGGSHYASISDQNNPHRVESVKVKQNNINTTSHEQEQSFLLPQESQEEQIYMEQYAEDPLQIHLGIQQELSQQTTDLEYHLEQKRFLKHKLKQQKKQILLEKHIQQQQEQQEQHDQEERDTNDQRQVMPEDFLTQQLDQHIKFHQKLQHHQTDIEDPQKTVQMYPHAKVDFLTQQLDQHISQHQQEQHRIKQKSTKIREQHIDSQRAMHPNQNSDIDINSSSPPEICATGNYDVRKIERTPGEGGNDDQNITGENGEENEGEETPLILQQHTLPFTRQKHKRSKSDLSDDCQQIIEQNEMKEQISFVPYSSISHSIKYDTYAQVPMNEPSNPSVVLAQSNLYGQHFSDNPRAGSTTTHPSLPAIRVTPKVVVHSPKDFPLNLSSSINNKQSKYNPQSQCASTPATQTNFSGGSRQTSDAGRENRSQASANKTISQAEYATVNSYSDNSSRTLPRNLPSRTVTFALTPQLFQEGRNDKIATNSPALKHDNRFESDKTVTSFMPYGAIGNHPQTNITGNIENQAQPPLRSSIISQVRDNNQLTNLAYSPISARVNSTPPVPHHSSSPSM